MAEGWAFTRTSRKAHYFVDTMALCGNWGFYQGPLQPEDQPSTDDCPKCRKKLEARNPVVAASDESAEG